MIEVLKQFGAAILGFGFIHFLGISIFKNKSYLTRFIVSLSISLIEIIACVIGIMIDRQNYSLPNISDFTNFLYYYAFLITSMLSLIVPLIFLIKGLINHNFRFNYNKYNKIKEVKQEKVYLKEKEDYVYVVIRCNNDYLLKSNQGKYHAIIRRLDNKHYFHDEIIKDIINEYDLYGSDGSNIYQNKMLGQVTIKAGNAGTSGTDKHYYCYYIDIYELNQSLNEFKLVPAIDLVNYDLEELDKQIIYRIILNDEFDIEL